MPNQDKDVECLKKATFAIHAGTEVWGTGFFVTENLALTAYHIFRDFPDKENFDAYYRNTRIKLRLVRKLSSEQADIAVLELLEHDNIEIRFIEAEYLDPNLPLPTRRRIWAGRDVCIFGYTAKVDHGNHVCLTDWHISASIDASWPLRTSVEMRNSKEWIEIERFHIWGSGIVNLRGMSGAPIMEMEHKKVIGVQGSYINHTSVRGTELGQLVDSYPEMKNHFKPFGKSTNVILNDIAAFVRWSDISLVTAISIDVRFHSGSEAGASVSNTQLKKCAQRAVERIVRLYQQMSSGNLKHEFEEYHMGANTLFCRAHYQLPEGDYGSEHVLEAGMALAYLHQALRDILRYNLELEIPAPQRRIVCAVGMAEEEIADDRNILDEALEKLPVDDRHATILCSREQYQRVKAIRNDVLRFIPVNDLNGILDTYLGEFMDETRTEMESKLTEIFGNELNTLLEQETELKFAEAAALGQEQRIQDMNIEILVHEDLKKYLEDKIEEVEQHLESAQNIPTHIEEVLDEYAKKIGELRKRHANEEPKKEESGTPVLLFLNPEIEDKVRAQAECKRLYRKLAKLCHVDTNPLQAPLFPHLADHYRSGDLLFLQSVEGVLNPIPGISMPTNIEKVCGLFDHLFFLHGVREQLKKRKIEMKRSIQDFQVNVQQDQAISKRTDLLNQTKFEINSAWCKLNYLLDGKVAIG